MSRQTINNVMDAQTDVAQETLDSLAKALGVLPPQIDRVLRLEGHHAPTVTPVGLVGEARELLRRAEKLLTNPQQSSGGGPGDPPVHDDDGHRVREAEGWRYLPKSQEEHQRKPPGRRRSS